VKPTRDEIAEAISDFMDMGELMEHNRRLSVAYLFGLLKQVEENVSKDAKRITENADRIARAADVFLALKKQVATLQRQLDELRNPTGGA
jgi:hypothetical protein